MEAEFNINDSAAELTKSMADLMKRQDETGEAVMLEVDPCGNVVAKLFPMDDTD